MNNKQMQSLQQWANDHEPDDKMLWKKAYWEQIVLVRDKIASLLTTSYAQYRDLVKVTGQHTSKSIDCPVYYIELPGVRIWMRYNYYDWNVSIDSLVPLDCDFLDTFAPDLEYCHCQGMEDKKFSSYADNKNKFTVMIASHYDLYTFFRVMKKHLGIKYNQIQCLV